MPLNTLEREVRRQRWLIIAAALIIGALVVVTGQAALNGAKYDAIRTVVVFSRRDCLQTTLSRTVAAGKSASDAIREYALSDHGRLARSEHHSSAVKAEQSVRQLLQLSGFPGYQDIRLEQVVALDARWPSLKLQRAVFCRRAYPLPR